MALTHDEDAAIDGGSIAFGDFSEDSPDDSDEDASDVDSADGGDLHAARIRRRDARRGEEENVTAAAEGSWMMFLQLPGGGVSVRWQTKTEDELRAGTRADAAARRDAYEEGDAEDLAVASAARLQAGVAEHTLPATAARRKNETEKRVA